MKALAHVVASTLALGSVADAAEGGSGTTRPGTLDGTGPHDAGSCASPGASGKGIAAPAR